ncbi:MAG TPA: universal stress protein [Acidimicrobiales bacterium]|nr:universal stress protein [Acidimicrobiales bacterium]
MTYTTVVVGTDGSETAQAAVLQAAQLAAADHGTVVVVSAYEPAAEPAANPDRLPDDIRWMLTDVAQAEGLAAKGREVAREQGASRVIVRAEKGDPATAILEVAEEFDAELIVVGSKGLGSPAHFLLGSVASRVAHHAPCDVLVVQTDRPAAGSRGK